MRPAEDSQYMDCCSPRTTEEAKAEVHLTIHWASQHFSGSCPMVESQDCILGARSSSEVHFVCFPNLNPKPQSQPKCIRMPISRPAFPGNNMCQIRWHQPYNVPSNSIRNFSYVSTSYNPYIILAQVACGRLWRCVGEKSKIRRSPWLEDDKKIGSSDEKE